MTATMTASILSVRVSADERSILEAAAEQANSTLSDFVRRRAIEAAEIEVLNRIVVTIPSEDWERFEAWASRPAESIPELVELGKTKPTWER